MPSESDISANPPPRVPSVFISYAAEDRPAARLLRDTLAAAGLDVWYDENELSGGDSWDQKIRRQIRDCDYFMPVISASTEARKEGYFRREWRLATERTLDMADDVLFLLPVALDDTPEMGARVPEKFLSVQWLRAPGGQSTPALMALLDRLRAGDHHALARGVTGSTRAPFAYHRTTAPLQTPPPPAPPPVLPPADPATARPARSHVPPPMPPLPHVPEKGGFFHGVKFIAEILWWLLTVAWMLFVRLPKWARVLVTIWVVITLFSSTRCSGPREKPPAPPAASQIDPPRNPEIPKRLRQALERSTQSARERGFKVEGLDVGKLASEVARVFGEDFTDNQAAAGKTLVVIPFSPPDAGSPAGKFAHDVFLSLYGRLALDWRGEIGVVSPLRGDPVPAVLLARATVLGASFVLAAQHAQEGEHAALTVKLFSVAQSAVIWSESYPIQGADDTVVAEKIAAVIAERVPRKEPHRKN